MLRRQFLATSAGLMAAHCWPSVVRAANESRRPKIALLGTVLFKHSHTQHLLDRLAMGYAFGGGWQSPRLEVAAVYLDQFPENDLGRERIEKYKLKAFDTVRDALTLGGTKLAVDGVIIIGEHGKYEKNEKGQVLYPRYKWFKEVVKVFEDSQRSVPVFNDKHLSTSWVECLEMVNDSRRLKFPFLAGSSVPVTWRHPSIDLPYGADLKESVCVASGGLDSYDFHAYEAAQCMSERRQGGEVGISSVTALKGDALWAELEKTDRQITRELFVAALSRSHNLPVEGGYPTAPVTYEWAKSVLPDSLGLFVEHRDGFRTTVFLGKIDDFNYAGYLGSKQIISCQMYLPYPGRGATTADFFTPLTRHLENMVLTGQAPYPIERTLLTSGMVIAGVESVHAGYMRYETPQMGVAYQAPRESMYWRE